MSWKNIFARKDLEALLAEAAGEHRLHRVLGPWALTALGVGCIIGAGIFVMTGRAAAQDAGPAVVLSYAIAGLGCVVAALCYAEFAAMAPVAGSAYTYAYTTLGEIFAWIIGWDLILEYAMGCATVASAWTHYFNVLLESIGLRPVSAALSHDPFWSKGNVHGIFNLPSVVIMGLVTIVLVIGIRESARTNAALVLAKLAVVLFVIAVGWGYVNRSNWTEVSVARRALPQEKKLIPDEVEKYLKTVRDVERAADDSGDRADIIKKQVVASYRIQRQQEEIDRLQQEGKLSATVAQAELKDLTKRLSADLPQTAEQRQAVADDPRPGREQAAGGRSRIVGHVGPAGVESLAGAHRRRHAQPVHALRPLGPHARGVDRFLRLHRLRFHLDPRRRGPPPATRRAHRHPRLALGLHPACTSSWRPW